MKYPTLSQTAVRELGNKRLDGIEADVETKTNWAGAGDEISIAHFGGLAMDFDSAVLHAPEGDRDKTEGQLAVRLYEAVAHLPTEALDSPGFWAYLSLAYFWDFIAWREPRAFNGDGDRWLVYVDGRVSTEGVLSRMYLRVKSVGGETFGGLAFAVPRSTDFWRSHIIRVRTGTAPSLTRALVRSHRDDRLSTESLRVLARDYLNRTWTNVVMTSYEDDEAEELILELRNLVPEVTPDPSGDGEDN